MVNLDEDVIWTGPSLYTVIWPGWLTKTNRKNINVNYNIYIIDISVFYDIKVQN